MPCLRASLAAFSAARPAAKGVLFRAPLKPTVPADAQESVSPFVSVIVTIVLLKVALMCATPRVTPLRIFFFAAAFAAWDGFPAASDIVFLCGSSGPTPYPRKRVVSGQWPVVRKYWPLATDHWTLLITCRVPSRPSYPRRSCAGPYGCGRLNVCAVRGPGVRGDDGCRDSCQSRADAQCSVGSSDATRLRPAHPCRGCR